jgi:hypothetical protein
MAQNPDNSPALTCRMTAEFRRCGWYVFGGALLIMLVVVGLAQLQLIPRRPWEAAIVGTVFVFGGLGLVVLVESWRLKLDSYGIARRRLWVWDPWPWQEFRDGKVRRRGSTLIADDHCWWCRELSLELVSDHERAAILKLWRELAPQIDPVSIVRPIPGEITVRYGFRTAHVGETGLRFLKDPSVPEIPWSGVRELRLFVAEHGMSEVRKVEIDLSDRTETLIAIHVIETPDSTEVVDRMSRIPPLLVEFLRSRVSSDVARVYANSGEPQSQEELEYWLAKSEKEMRLFTRLQWILPPVFFVGSAAVMFPKLMAGWQMPGFMLNRGWLILELVLMLIWALMYPTLIGAVLQHRRQPLMKRIQELKTWEAQQERSGPPGKLP